MSILNNRFQLKYPKTILNFKYQIPTCIFTVTNFDLNTHEFYNPGAFPYLILLKNPSSSKKQSRTSDSNIRDHLLN